MTDIEKVTKGLDCCLGTHDCELEPKEDCPYNGMCLCAMALQFDVMALLKRQKAVEPITDNEDGYWCGSCHEDMVWHQKYCSNCGRPVKWE